MAEAKEIKIAKTELKTAGGEGLIGSFISHGVDLAERTTTTCFGIVRDVRGLVRAIDERLDKLVVDALDAGEAVALGIIRTVGDTGHGVTELAGQLTRPREASRAA